MNNAPLIILTSTVHINPAKYYMYQTDPASRISTYLSAIRKWLTQTNFNICLVENSGYSFEELSEEKEKYANRFEVICFNEREEPTTQHLANNTSKGQSELYAINWAYSRSKFRESSPFIIKLTARYFISQLEDYLAKYNLDEYGSLSQNNRDRCEMVGCHARNFNIVFNESLIDEYGMYHSHIEDVWKKRTEQCLPTLVCDEFEIERTIRGGAPEDCAFTTI